jgi:prepilin-type N-terminal cleavage/methylation domain-containing protein
MFKKFNKSDSQGFTIVEVMFVLAIAAMIMLIVFLAVPALQRNSRNTGRKSDAGRISSAITNYISNNNGTLPPTGAAWTTNGACASIQNDAGTLAQYVGLTCFSGSQGSGHFDVEVGLNAAPTAVTGNEVIYVEQAVCNPAAAGRTTTTGASSRSSALLYSLETSSGNYNWTCISVS